MSLSLDFRAVVWRTEEEGGGHAAFGIYYYICDFPRRCRISTHLYVVSHHFICLMWLFAKQPAIAMKRFVLLIIFLVYYLSFLQ